MVDMQTTTAPAPSASLIEGVFFNGRPVVVDTTPRGPSGERLHVGSPCGGWCRRCLLHDDPGGCVG